MKNMKRLLLTIFACVCVALSSNAQTADSLKSYANGLLYYPDGRVITVEDYMNWINTIQDPAIRIAKKEELMELLD